MSKTEAEIRAEKEKLDGQVAAEKERREREEERMARLELGPTAINLEEARVVLGGRVSTETIREALKCGDMKGRNVGGNVGWLTTVAEALNWVVKGNGPEKRDVRSDHNTAQGAPGEGDAQHATNPTGGTTGPA